MCACVFGYGIGRPTRMCEVYDGNKHPQTLHSYVPSPVRRNRFVTDESEVFKSL